MSVIADRSDFLNPGITHKYTFVINNQSNEAKKFTYFLHSWYNYNVRWEYNGQLLGSRVKALENINDTERVLTVDIPGKTEGTVTIYLTMMAGGSATAYNGFVINSPDWNYPSNTPYRPAVTTW